MSYNAFLVIAKDGLQLIHYFLLLNSYSMNEYFYHYKNLCTIHIMIQGEPDTADSVQVAKWSTTG